ncbi:MAG TPA: tRNA pseudouridine(55) synthase TruB [Gammaproteobacteria bacterium]
MAKRRDRGEEIHGILLLDKPGGRTSNQVLQHAKRLFRAAKAGHTGSLDPLATGMLPICFGAATRISSYLLNASKSYRVTAKLGQATDSGDADGSIIESAEVPALNDVDIRAVLDRWLGKSEQTPPMHSALKHRGRRLYELARDGIEVARQPRPIEIENLVLETYEPPELRFAVTCSKGTYVRTLVEDVARDLGTLGHVLALRRTAVGPFREHEMISLERLDATAEDSPEKLLILLRPVDSPLQQMPRVDLAQDACAMLSHGRPVPADVHWPVSTVRLYGPQNVFFGIGEVEPAGRLVPRRIFPGLSSWS